VDTPPHDPIRTQSAVIRSDEQPSGATYVTVPATRA
jgi:hypothetical protein